MGASAGLIFRYEGLLGRFDGSWPRAALIAASTSRAAASMLRLRSNCKVTLVVPRPLLEVISVNPAICPNCRSRGDATVEAITCGLAPGREALTWMVGKSTCGRGDTGKKRNAMTPASAIAAVNSVVPTELRTNASEKLIIQPLSTAAPRRPVSLRLRPGL